MWYFIFLFFSLQVLGISMYSVLLAQLSPHLPHCKAPAATGDPRLPSWAAELEGLEWGSGSSHSAPVQVFQRHHGSTWPGPGWFSSPGCPVSCFLAYTAHPTSCLLARPFLDIQVSEATCLTTPPSLPPILVAWPPSPRPRTAVPPRLGSSPPAAACPRCPPRRKSPRPGTSMTVPGSSGAPAWTGPAQTWNPLTGWRGRPHRTPAPQRRWTTSPLSM